MYISRLSKFELVCSFVSITFSIFSNTPRSFGYRRFVKYLMRLLPTSKKTQKTWLMLYAVLWLPVNPQSPKSKVLFDSYWSMKSLVAICSKVM